MEKAKWIWQNCNNNADEYVIFYDEFHYINDKISIDISCDSNYTMYLNGKLVGFGQYADYPHYKVYDTIDLSKFVNYGNNKIVIIVWYYGDDSQTYTKGNAGLIYEVKNNNEIITYSKPGTLCKIANDYINHAKKVITAQLGFTYKYDTRNYEDFEKIEYLKENFDNAIEVRAISYYLYQRPIKSLVLNETIFGKIIDEKKQIYDVGCERVGFLHIKFKAKSGSLINISYGEHLADGEVRRKIENRDFSVELIANGESFEYLNTFRRLGCRYLQINSEEKVVIEFIGIKETMYPLEVISFKANNELQQRIYDVSVRTLQLCMHEHYEDCPWREQALYTMDSRNQMLCGYYAFNEFEYARANLILMSKGQRKDNLLPLCFPAGKDVPIPFFSLIYIVQMNEYANYSNDYTLIRENKNLLEDIINVFLDRIEANGLVANFKDYWNFYEWSVGLDGVEDGSFISSNYKKSYDLPLNCFLILGLKNLMEIYNKLKINNNYDKIIEKLQTAVYNNFFVEEKGMFQSYIGKEENFSKLSNSLAILTGCSFNYERMIGDKIINNNSEMEDITLSMKVFEYDALLKIDKNYSKFIIKDIEKLYGYMLQNNATSFWETIFGEKDFDNAGSLCHGWSAIPVYYLRTLKCN